MRDGYLHWEFDNEYLAIPNTTPPEIQRYFGSSIETPGKIIITGTPKQSSFFDTLFYERVRGYHPNVTIIDDVYLTDEERKENE